MKCGSCANSVWAKISGDPKRGELKDQGAILVHYCILPNDRIIDATDLLLLGSNLDSCEFFQEGSGHVYKRIELKRIGKNLHEWWAKKEYFDFLRKIGSQSEC